MPKGFSEKEKELIRSKLLQKGREYFEKYGLRKTSVEDLTRAAGISKGAFYIFFDSKEELFLEILEAFEADFREGLFGYAFQPGTPARESFKNLLRTALVSWDRYPLLKSFDKEEFEYLVRKIPPERVQAHVNRDDAFVGEFMEKWKREGRTMRGDPQTVSGLMKALFFVSLHKDDFGKDVYPETMELLINLVADYLIEDQ